MRVIVDKEKCQGHNRCVALAPEIFDVDDEGLAVVLTDRVPEEHQTQVKRAELACPERAIRLEDDESV